jgi:hypothetical protein
VSPDKALLHAKYYTSWVVFPDWMLGSALVFIDILEVVVSRAMCRFWVEYGYDHFILCVLANSVLHYYNGPPTGEVKKGCVVR